MSRINRHYRNIAYALSWKYPRLYSALQRFAFPIQLTFLCLIMFKAVSAYQSNFSYDASVQSARSADNTVALNSAPAVKTQSSQTEPARENTLHSKKILATKKSLQEEIHRAEMVLKGKKREIRELETKLKNAKALLTSEYLEAGLVQRSVDAGEPVLMRNEEWIQSREADEFIIQIASSTDFQSLLQIMAQLDLEKPVATYPFKRDKDGNLVYGVSMGVYPSRNAARLIESKLPDGFDQHGTWIRPISEIQSLLEKID